MDNADVTEADLAWLKVRQTIREVGSYRNVDLGPVVNAAVRACGGWVKACTNRTQDLARFGEEYVRWHRFYSEHEPTPSEGQYLVGLCDQKNAGFGLPAGAPATGLA